MGYSKQALREIRPLRDVKLHPAISEQKIDPASRTLTVKLQNRGGGIGPVRVLVNGKTAVEDARDAKLKVNPFVDAATITVDLNGSAFIAGTENNIEIVCYNYDPVTKQGYISSRDLKLTYKDANPRQMQPPTLYAIIAGVSDYADPELSLRFAAKDAEDMATAVRLGAQRLFGTEKVHVKLLSTSGNAGTVMPTKANFRKAFEDVAKQAKPDDILFIYLSGHGVSLGLNTDTYLYMTQEARVVTKEVLSNPDLRSSMSISSGELIDWITQTEWVKGEKGIKALKQVMVLDTCAAGAAAEKFNLAMKKDLSSDQIRAIERLKDRTGFHVLMGSAADAVSYEASRYGQGLVTYALLQGMRGAALREGEFVDVQKLFQYVADEVPKLAQNIGGIQRPVIAAPFGTSFDVGQLKEDDRKRVPLSLIKPILLRPFFFNADEGVDTLNLIPALKKRFDEASFATKRGNESFDSMLVYIDEDVFPGAILPTGRYTIDGEQVRVKVILRQSDKTIIKELPEIVGTKKDITGLIDKIMQELMKSLEQITANPQK